MEKLTYIDLFAGCGGLSLGLANAGWHGLFAIEKSKDAFHTLKYNLIDNQNHFDWPEWLPIQNHDINLLLERYEKRLKALKGKVDMVVGGPPCQGFSSAGRRDPKDARNQMVVAYMKFIEFVQPKIIFLENVPGFDTGFLENGKRGTPYSTMVKETLGKNYNIIPKIINFQEYGVPQRRNRFILVGVKKVKMSVLIHFFKS